MAKLLDSRRRQDKESSIELYRLDKSWAPWRYQVSIKVDDGKNFGRPGESMYVSCANFLEQNEARRAFVA